jgi:RNA polymerase sigma-70 factor, ECF subfamily
MYRVLQHPGATAPEVDPAVDAVVDDGKHLDGFVELARGGDVEAFGRLFEVCHPSVYRYLLRLTRSEVLAEDLTAEAFLRALRNVSGFQGGGAAFRSWVIVIARNLALDHFGSGRYRLEQSTDDLETRGGVTAGSDREVVDGCTRDLILDALEHVSPAQREVVVGRFLEDLSIAELAAQVGRTEGAVKQLQWRGLRSLARVLSDEVRAG